MDLRKIVAISGIGGLHSIVGQRPNGLIVETIDEQKKRFPTTLNHKISVLEDIAIYTNTGEVMLRDLMIAIYKADEDGLNIPNTKGPGDELRAFMEAVLPDHDQERVYTSDIKKLIKWYQILKSSFDLSELKTTEEDEKEAEGSDEKSSSDTSADNQGSASE